MKAHPPLTLVVGARPNFVKAAPLLPELRKAGFRIRLVHTGQHYDPGMSQALFRDLGLPRPDANLGVGSGSHASQTAKALERFDRDLLRHPPRAVLVFGDVNSTLAAALAAARRGIPLAHVEAGLRSFDRGMPEELNRILVDHLSTLLFTTLPEDDRNLRREGIPTARIRRVGNLMADTLRLNRARALRLAPTGRFALATLHRPGNVDDPLRLRRILEGLGRVARHLPLLLPAHPRLASRLRDLPAGILRTGPLGYLAFQGALGRAHLVLTDSGGVQHEAALWGTPCLTLRDSTEWGFTVRRGVNRLVAADPAVIERAALRALRGPRKRLVPPLWDGHSARRVARSLKDWLA